MSEFIFKAKTFTPRHDAVQALLVEAEAIVEAKNDAEFQSKYDAWKAREDKRKAEKKAEDDTRQKEKDDKAAKEAADKSSMEQLRTDIKARAKEDYERAVATKNSAGFFSFLYTVDDLDSYESKRFYQADWSRNIDAKDSEWKPPMRNKYDDKEARGDYIVRRRDYYEERFYDEKPNRRYMRNQFTKYIAALKPLASALAIGADEVRLDGDTMALFLSAENSAKECVWTVPMKLSDMINAHVNAVATNTTTGKAVLTHDIETVEASMKKGETLTIMYQQGNMYHGEHNDFSAMLERGDFEWVDGQK